MNWHFILPYYPIKPNAYSITLTVISHKETLSIGVLPVSIENCSVRTEPSTSGAWRIKEKLNLTAVNSQAQSRRQFICKMKCFMKISSIFSRRFGGEKISVDASSTNIPLLKYYTAATADSLWCINNQVKLYAARRLVALPFLFYKVISTLEGQISLTNS